MLELEHARQLLVDFKMPEAACQLDACLERAARQDASFISFLDQILTLQKKAQEDKNVKRRMKLSHLPERKTLEEFDFDFQPSINRKQIQELSSMAFVERAENLILWDRQALERHTWLRLLL